MADKRQDLLDRIWTSQDTAYDLMLEYDSLPHRYGEHTLYQAEAQLIALIALHPDITITDIANILRKTPSACSQIVRKLRAKGWVVQIRNESNNRVLNLRMTAEGEKVFRAHDQFVTKCKKMTFEKLADFTDAELLLYLNVQKKINEAYQEDVRRSRESFQ